MPYKKSFKTYLILCAALGLCAACGVRGALSLPPNSKAVAPVSNNAAVLMGADGRAVAIEPAQTTPDIKPKQ